MNQTSPQKQNALARKEGLRSALTYLFLSVWAVVVLFPFYWMVLTSIKSYGAYNSEHTPVFVTLSPTLENYQNAFTAVPLGGYLLNTLIFAVATTAAMVVVSTLAAYAFARLRFRGKNLVFGLFLSKAIQLTGVHPAQDGCDLIPAEEQHSQPLLVCIQHFQLDAFRHGAVVGGVAGLQLHRLDDVGISPT